MRKLFVAAMLLAFHLLTGAVAHAAPRVAVVYSSFHSEQYRNEQTPILAELGWQQDQYENTKITELVDKLSTYDLVVLGTVYNYENPQDLARDASKWLKYLEDGGCLVVEDANYPQMYSWLESVHPGMRWLGSGETNPYGDSPVKWVSADHPLMQGARVPGTPWTRPRFWSQMLTPLVVDAGGRPVVAYLEVGKGIVVISSAYPQYGWPDARFHKNLLTWAKDSNRIASVERRQSLIADSSRARPELDLPTLREAPTIDGQIDDKEWQGSAILREFIGINGQTQRTVCRVALSADSLYVAFECTDNDMDGITKNCTERDDASWLDDCVEVFLDPAAKGASSLQFTVNSLGVQFDARDGDPSWDRFWTAKTGIRPGSWCAEIRIPLASLSTSGDEPLSSVCAANFDRRVSRRDGLGHIISGWAPSVGGFSAPAGFGLLKGIRFATRALSPELTVVQPKTWMVGRNRVSVTVTPAGRQIRANIACIDANTGRKVASSNGIRLTSGKPVRVGLDVPIETDGAHAFQLVAFDTASPNSVLASSSVLRVTADPAFTVQMLNPAFRGVIQSHDPNKRLTLSGEIGGMQEKNLRVRAAITADGKSTPRWQQSMSVKPNAKFLVESSLADLPLGDYSLRVDLVGDGGRLLGWRQMPIRVLPPAPVEVTFDDRRICYVDGKPFFPIGLYHVSPAALDHVNARNREIGLPEITMGEALQSVKEHGFNCVHHTWVMASDEYLSKAQDLGLLVMPEIGAPDEASLKQMVATANKHKNLLLWYGIDEPSGERLKTAMNAHDMFARVDPHRPVSAACCNPAVFPGGAKAYDIITMDPYFIRHAPLTGIADWIEQGMKAGQGARPIWVVPQAFTVDNSPWSEPTNEELRCQAYLSVVHGATGLVWYAYWSSEPYKANPKGRNQWFLPDSHLWEYFPKLNAEIQTLSPVFLTGTSLGPVECGNKDIHTNRWIVNGTEYLIAVNPTNNLVRCTLGKVKPGKVEVMFENRTLTPSGDSIEDSFRPLEAHVYRF